MSESSVEYNVVINGILAGHKPEDVAELVAPILGIHSDEALMLFNGVAHTVLQRVDLSEAASFQARLKDNGIDASVAVAADAPRPDPAAEQEQIPEESAPLEEAAEVESPATAEAEIAEPEAPAEQVPQAETQEPEVAEPEAFQAAAAQPEAPEPEAVKPEAPEQEAADSVFSATEFAETELTAADTDATEPESTEETFDAPDVELDLSVLEAAQQASVDEEPEDRLARLEDSPEIQEKVRQHEARKQKRAEREQLLDALEGDPEVMQVSKEMDLDEMFADGEEAAPAAQQKAARAKKAPEKAAPAENAPEQAAPAKKAKPRAPAIELAEEPARQDEDRSEPAPASETEEIVVQAAQQDPTPGANMLCPACHTLQPRAPQCRACGAMVADFEDSPGAETKTRLPPRLSRNSVLSAAGAAIVGAGAWLGVAHGMEFEAGFPALLVGCLVGLACGLTGGRGAKAGFTAAGLTAVAIIAASLLMPKDTPTELPAPVQPDPSTVWSDAEAPQRYKQSLDDAETFMTTDGSVRAIREFMIQRRYTRATSPEQIPQSDLRHFYDVDAPDLSWIVENQPDLESWSQRMRGHLSGRQRVSLNVSAPPIEPVRAGITTLQLVLMVLGIVSAFGLGQVGLRRKD